MKLWAPCVSTDIGAIEMEGINVDPSEGILPPITMNDVRMSLAETKKSVTKPSMIKRLQEFRDAQSDE